MNATTVSTSREAATNVAPPADYSRTQRYRVAILTFGVAAIHFAVVPDHLDEYLPFGLFFIVLGFAQVALGLAAIIRPSQRLFAWAAFGTLAVLALWVITRTVGLPIGPDAGQPEAMGVTDVCAAVLEGVAVLLFALLAWGPRLKPRPNHGWWQAGRIAWNSLTILLTTLLVLIFSTFGTLAGANGMPRAVNLGSAVAGQPAVSVDSLTEPPGSQPLRSFTLTAQVTQIGGKEVWAYNGTVPGPELRVTQGDRVRVTLVNHLPAATTIHWHGLRLPNAEDGVAGVTQNAVPPGGSFVYEFVVKYPGTYWYHSHQDAFRQIPMGLYGALIVEPPVASSLHYDHDYAVAFGDVGAAVFGAVANGAADGLHLAAKPGESVRLRLINATLIDMPGTPEFVALVGVPYTIIALDGYDLNQPTLLGPELLPIGTGQRYDLAFTMPASGQVRLSFVSPDAPTPAVQQGPNIGDIIFGPSKIRHNEVVILGEGAVPPQPAAGSLPVFDLTSYGKPAYDAVASRTSFDISQDLHIGSNPGFRDGAFENIHTINGKTDPYTDPIIVHLGQVVRLRFINETDEYHPMHIHGHIFSVLSKNGKPISGSPVHLDSILVGPHETWEVAFLADNPGLWMLHCHVLVHAAYGLSMMIDYADISTPYTIGTLSGNMPH